MNFVADTNAFITAALDDPGKDRIIELTVSAAVLVPDCLARV